MKRMKDFTLESFQFGLIDKSENEFKFKLISTHDHLKSEVNENGIILALMDSLDNVILRNHIIKKTRNHYLYYISNIDMAEEGVFIKMLRKHFDANEISRLSYLQKIALVKYKNEDPFSVADEDEPAPRRSFPNSLIGNIFRTEIAGNRPISLISISASEQYVLGIRADTILNYISTLERMDVRSHQQAHCRMFEDYLIDQMDEIDSSTGIYSILNRIFEEVRNYRLYGTITNPETIIPRGPEIITANCEPRQNNPVINWETRQTASSIFTANTNAIAFQEVTRNQTEADTRGED